MLDLVIEGRRRDLGGGLEVGRVLPFARRRMVGPFIFLDHMGPADFRAGEGIDVRPHPHIGLSTVTYLFDGEIHHHDNLGVSQKIRPGEVNWMTAGSGIVHSERTDPSLRSSGGLMHGMQAWVALPREDEETAPAFAHHDAGELPELSDRWHLGAADRRLRLWAEQRRDHVLAAVLSARRTCRWRPDGDAGRARRACRVCGVRDGGA